MTVNVVTLAHEALSILIELVGYTVLGIAAFVGFVKLVNRLSRPS